MDFHRSRLEKKKESDVTKKTVISGVFTIFIFLLVIVFGLPLLIKLSVFLGEVKSRVNSTEIEKIVPPVAPRLIVPFEATNSAKIDISGYAEKGAEVELFKNDVSMGKTNVTEGGDFKFEGVDLVEGENGFTAVSRKNKAVSEATKSIVVIYDNKASEIKMTNPVEDSLKVDNADFDIKGMVDKDSSVTINSRVAVVDNEGNFKLKYKLSVGKNDIEIVVKDSAGNEVTKKIAITYDF